MERIDTTKMILIGIAGFLIVLLAVIMVLGSCSNRNGPEWNYHKDTTGSVVDDTGNAGGNAGNNATDGTGNAGGNAGNNGNQSQTGSQSTTPSLDLDVGVVDRNELEQEMNRPADSTTAPTTQPTTKPTTQPTQPTTKPTTGIDGLLTWEAYQALSREEKIAYENSFEDADAFAAWWKAAKEEYYSSFPTFNGELDFGKN